MSRPTPSLAAGLPTPSLVGGEATTPMGPLPGSGPRVAAFAAGDVLAGRYRVIRFLAEGGMGEVYEVEDLELGGRLAAKTVRTDVARQPEALERFRREIQLARRVTHPNVCRIFDLAHHPSPTPGAPGTVFLTMQLLVGETLSARIARGGAMTPDQALPIVRQIAAAVGAAHDVGVVHRDLKPANVLLEPGKDGAERAVVTDFGLARTETGEGDGATMTAAGFFLGTPAYIAPEQLVGGATSPATDLYALGIVMFEMLTGRVPFQGDTALATAVKRLQEAPPSPRELSKGVDARWEGAILRCLEREPQDRFPSAAELVRALEEQAVAAPPPAPVIPVSAPAQTRGRWAKLVGLAALILVSFGVLAYRIQSWRQEQALREELLATTPPPAVAPAPPAAAEPTLAWVPRSGGPGSPTHPEAAALYEAGLERLAAFDAAGAREVLERAATLDPDNALVHAALATAWANLGHEAKSAEAARRALELAGNLPQDQRLLIEGRVAEAARDWQRATEIYRSLVRAFPDDLDHRLRLAAAERIAGQGEEARATLEQVRQLPAAAAEAPRIDLAEAALAEAGGDFARQLELAERAATAAAARGVRAITAQARLSACRALRQLGRLDDGRAACEAARGLFAEAGDSAGVADALGQSANLLYDQGDLPGAVRLFEQALGKYRTIGNRYAEAGLLNNLAVVLRRQGELPAALELYDQVLDLVGELGDRPGEAHALGNLAAGLAVRGEVGKAREMLERSLTIRRDLGDVPGQAAALDTLGSVLRQQGDLPGARRRHEEALALRRQLGQRSGEAASLAGLAAVLLDQGDLPAARERAEAALKVALEVGNKSLEALARFALAEVLVRSGDFGAARTGHTAALALRRELGERSQEGASRLALAALERAAGDLVAAESEARAAAEEFARLGATLDQAQALALAGEAAERQGRGAAAREAFTRTRELAEGGESARGRLALALVLAPRSTPRPEAERQVRAALADAERVGWFEARLEASLALAAFEPGAEGAARRAAVAREAAAKGFGELAARAGQ
ncbi:MAG: tetratricopeptide repeat protein [Thermoanaerobaculia bacterium]|nr:tetratricopeptide repeat protein [Thermoanaerobaculia bacterium]